MVTRRDRLGRDALDVQGTVRRLAEISCSVHVLQFGVLDLASSAGELVLSALAAVAEMERDLLIRGAFELGRRVVGDRSAGIQDRLEDEVSGNLQPRQIRLG